MVIAADLGGTLLRTGVVRPPHTILHQSTRRVEDRRGNEEIEALLRAALTDAVHWTHASHTPVAATGLAVPGLIDPAQGVMRYSTNLGVRDLPVAAIARDVVTGPVVVENDVRAAAWAEWVWGAGRGSRIMAYLSVGTGVAAALVYEDRLYHGADAAAGELGHIPVVPDGDSCRCGQRGCLETVAGGWGILRRAERLARQRASALTGPSAREELTTEHVFQAAAEGDSVAGSVLAEAGGALGRAAVTLLRLWNPERLVLGGGLLLEASPLAREVQRAVAASTLYGEPMPPVSLAKFAGSSGLIGAAGLALAA
jgi:glucokinase